MRGCVVVVVVRPLDYLSGAVGVADQTVGRCL